MYAYAKLNLLCFWDFAFAKESIDDCVREDTKESWEKNKHIFFASEDSTPYEFNGESIPFKKYDRRAPDNYKSEFVGTGMISLNSKVYHVWSFNRDNDGKFITKN